MDRKRMNLEPKLESLEATLKGLKPATASEELLSKLEAALVQADAEKVAEPSKIIHFPFTRWAVAAAAMFAALLMAVSSTRVDDSTSLSEESGAGYRLQDGYLVPDSDGGAVLPVDVRMKEVPQKNPLKSEIPNETAR